MDDIVWESTFDVKYHCEVRRTGTHTGLLVVTDPDGKRVMESAVGLSYGAQFGPDVDDVSLWHDMIEKWLG